MRSSAWGRICHRRRIVDALEFLANVRRLPIAALTVPFVNRAAQPVGEQQRALLLTLKRAISTEL